MATYIKTHASCEQLLTKRSTVVQSVIKLLEQQHNYRDIGILGSGTFGDVFQMYDPRNQKSVAAKIVTSEMMTEAESTLWPELDHPNVIRLTEILDLKDLNAFVFVMPIQPTNLRTILKGLKFRAKKDALGCLKNWLRQILFGIEYLHAQDLCHLDIKDDNILISHSFKAMLCDFTYLNTITKPLQSHSIGSPYIYRAPEAFYKDIFIDGKANDMYSFGTMTLELLTMFYLSEDVKSNERDWLQAIYPTLYDILQFDRFESRFCDTFSRLRCDIAKQARTAFHFVHGFLKMDPTERRSASDSVWHKFLTGESTLENNSDDVWIDKITLDVKKFKKEYFQSSNKELSSNSMEKMNGQLSLPYKMPVNSEEKTSTPELKKGHDEKDKMPVSKILESLRQRIQKLVEKSEKADEMAKRNSNGDKEIKGPHSMEESNVRISLPYKLPLDSEEKSTAPESTEKYDAGDEVPVSKKLKNLRQRIVSVYSSLQLLFADEKYTTFGSTDAAADPEGIPSHFDPMDSDSSTHNEADSLDICIQSPSSENKDENRGIGDWGDRSRNVAGESAPKMPATKKDKGEVARCLLSQIKSNELTTSEEVESKENIAGVEKKKLGCRKRFTGWMRSKCFNFLMCCCPCVTRKAT